MELKGMTFSPDNNGDVIPKTITVEMTVKEALWIAIVSGEQKGESPHTGIFNCLNGDVFNRYWDDGADDALKEIHVETPPIKYENKTGMAS